VLLKFLIFCFAVAMVIVARFNRRLSTAILSAAMCFFAFAFSFTPTIHYFVVPVASEPMWVSDTLSVGSGMVETVSAGNVTLVVVSGFNTYDYLAFYVYLFLLVVSIIDLYMLATRVLRERGGGTS